jgi:hypothetical protein
VAGLGGLAIAAGRSDQYHMSGAHPTCERGIWREGWIVNPVLPVLARP